MCCDGVYVLLNQAPIIIMVIFLTVNLYVEVNIKTLTKNCNINLELKHLNRMSHHDMPMYLS